VKTLSLLFFLFFTSYALAAPVAVVTKLRGTVLYNGEQLTKGQKISAKGELEVKKSSFVKITIEAWNNSIVLGPRSKMAIDFEQKNPKKKYTFLKGACRWMTGAAKNSASKKKGGVSTRYVSFAVRGTDFILKSNDYLGETEIVVLDGQVEMSNPKKEGSKALINKGQWGGLGGRFGSDINGPVDLPPKAIKHFSRQLKI
jgi:hypothetical protein